MWFVKIILAILLLFCYYAGYNLFYLEIGKEDYSIPSMIFGLIISIFGIWGHIILIFKDLSFRLQNNTNFVSFCFIVVLGVKALFIIGLFPFSIYLLYNNCFKKTDHFKNEDLIVFTGTLRENPIYVTHSKGSPDLYIVLNEYKSISFEPKHNSYIHYNTDFEEKSKKGDSVRIGVLKEDYLKFVIKSKTTTFYEKHFENHIFINLYYLEKRNKIYYNCIIHNQIDKAENSFSFIMLLIALVCMFVSVTFQYIGYKTIKKLIKKSKKRIQSKKRFLNT